jgi:DNA-binding transcriptional LysR family regulator
MVLLSKARAVSGGIDDLRASVKGLLGGLEAHVALAVDVMMPTARLVDAVKAFEAQFPTVLLRVHVEALSAVAQLVQSGTAGIGIAGAQHIRVSGLEHVDVGGFVMIPVAAPDHPLAQDPPRRPGEARRHRQLILTVRSSFDEEQDVAVFGDERWQLTDLGAKHALLVAGSGWGFMPEPAVQQDLAAGRLVHLNLPDARGGFYGLRAIYRTDTPPRPAAAWMIQRFVEQAV